MSLNHLIENSIKEYLNPGCNQLRSNRLVSGVSHLANGTLGAVDVSNINVLIKDFSLLTTLQSLANGVDGQVINILAASNGAGPSLTIKNNVSVGFDQVISTQTNADISIPSGVNIVGSATLVYSSVAGKWYCYAQ